MFNRNGIRGASLTVIVGAAILSSSFAHADPSVSSHEMQTALAKASEGSTALRRYVERTKPIYALDYNEVMAVAEKQKAMASVEPTKVARAGTK